MYYLSSYQIDWYGFTVTIYVYYGHYFYDQNYFLVMYYLDSYQIDRKSFSISISITLSCRRGLNCTYKYNRKMNAITIDTYIGHGMLISTRVAGLTDCFIVRNCSIATCNVISIASTIRNSITYNKNTSVMTRVMSLVLSNVELRRHQTTISHSSHVLTCKMINLIITLSSRVRLMINTNLRSHVISGTSTHALCRPRRTPIGSTLIHYQDQRYFSSLGHVRNGLSFNGHRHTNFHMLVKHGQVKTIVTTRRTVNHIRTISLHLGSTKDRTPNNLQQGHRLNLRLVHHIKLRTTILLRVTNQIVIIILIGTCSYFLTLITLIVIIHVRGPTRTKCVRKRQVTIIVSTKNFIHYNKLLSHSEHFRTRSNNTNMNVSLTRVGMMLHTSKLHTLICHTNCRSTISGRLNIKTSMVLNTIHHFVRSLGIRIIRVRATLMRFFFVGNRTYFVPLLLLLKEGQLVTLVAVYIRVPRVVIRSILYQNIIVKSTQTSQHNLVRVGCFTNMIRRQITIYIRGTRRTKGPTIRRFRVHVINTTTLRHDLVNNELFRGRTSRVSVNNIKILGAIGLVNMRRPHRVHNTISPIKQVNTVNTHIFPPVTTTKINTRTKKVGNVSHRVLRVERLPVERFFVLTNYRGRLVTKH